jgi:hypothetical protein
VKHSYSTMLENVEITYSYAAGYANTREEPGAGPEVDVFAVWLLNDDLKRVVDILPTIDKTPGAFEALFGKYIMERLAQEGADNIADEQAAAAEYRAEMRRD